MILHDFADVLSYLSPPLCVVERLAAQRASLCPDAINFLGRWYALRTGDPLPELDDWLAQEYGPAPGPRPSPDTAQEAGAEEAGCRAVDDCPHSRLSSVQPPAHRPGGIGTGQSCQ